MEYMAQETKRKPNRGRLIGRILLILAALFLLMCLATSLVANAGLGGWAFWIQRQLTQEEERTTALQEEIERLIELLQENDIEIPVSPADTQLMDTVEGQVTALRGLSPLYSVDRTLISQSDLYDQTLDEFDTEFPPEEAHDYALTLAAFDMVETDVDMYDLLLRLYTEQIAGYYDPETEEVYIVADVGPMGQMERLTYAHEFTHVLQDQHFDLESLGFTDDDGDEFDSEYLGATRALVEGDASLLERQFLSTYYTADELARLMEESLAIDQSILDEVPDILRDSLFFPYEYGLTFVEDLYEAGGWAAVDAAYADPPLSTEQILHPERYRAGDAPQIVALPPLTDTLGTGWRQVDEDVLGEYFTRFYLTQQISTDEAMAAAEGWGGDRYTVFYSEATGALAMALHITWDTPGDAEEFVDAYVTYATRRFDGDGLTEGAQTCWTGEADALCLTWGSVDTIIALGPDEPTVESLLNALATD
jgi:hypothetical protein